MTENLTETDAKNLFFNSRKLLVSNAKEVSGNMEDEFLNVPFVWYEYNYPMKFIRKLTYSLIASHRAFSVKTINLNIRRRAKYWSRKITNVCLNYIITQ